MCKGSLDQDLFLDIFILKKSFRSNLTLRLLQTRKATTLIIETRDLFD